MRSYRGRLLVLCRVHMNILRSLDFRDSCFLDVCCWLGHILCLLVLAHIRPLWQLLGPKKGFFQLQIPTFGGLLMVGTYFGWNIGVWSIAANTALLQQYNNTFYMKPLSWRNQSTTFYFSLSPFWGAYSVICFRLYYFLWQ